MGELIRDRYEPLEVVGRGGQGEVVRALDRLHDRDVALKIREVGDDREALLAEARILLGLKPHPGVTLVREDFFADDGRYVLVMDWISGRDLRTVLEQEGPLPFERACEVLAQVAEALDHLHSHDPPIVHKDVKPENVLLTADGRIVLVDFGVAQGGGAYEDAGTGAYRAPEAARSTVTPAADVFAFAVVAHELLTGVQPSRGEPDWSGVVGEHEDRVRAALEAGMAVDPARRPASAAELVAHLDLRGSPGQQGEEGTLAVLPFRVLGRSQEAEVLAAGLHSDLLTELTKLSAMTVISRTSVMGYRDSDKPVPRIARELNVATMVEGTVQSSGSRVRLTVQLIDAVEDNQLWAEHYDRELTTEDLFSIQTELTQRIVESLHTELSPKEEERLSAEPPTDDLDAYRCAVEGRMQLDRKTKEGFLRAIELFEKAVELDPEFADAWVGLADSLTAMHGYGHADEELLERGEKALRRALVLAPGSAGAHTSLGLFLSHPSKDGPGSIREFKRAIELNPGYADAYNWHSWVSKQLGRGEEAARCSLRAVELNPLSVEVVSNLTTAYLATGQPEQALAEARRAQQLSPEYPSGFFFEGTALYELGRFPEAIQALTPLSTEVAGDLTVRWAGLGPDVTLALAHAADGNHTEAEGISKRIDADAEPFAAGLILAALGEHEKALEEFGKVDEMAYWPTLAVRYLFRRVWEPLREDPRFEALVAVADRTWGVESSAEF